MSKSGALFGVIAAFALMALLYDLGSGGTALTPLRPIGHEILNWWAMFNGR